MTERRFPVAGTELTVPWEVMEETANEWVRRFGDYSTRSIMEVWERQGGLTEAELNTWYGKHWREVAQ